MNMQERMYIRSTYYTLNILSICIQTIKQIFKKQFCKIKSGMVYRHTKGALQKPQIQNEPVKTVTEQFSIHMVSQKPCSPGEHENSS